jgi:hypothetical protein
VTASPRRWAKGCGCGCGPVLLVLGLLGRGGYLFVKDIGARAERADEVSAELRERHGAVSGSASTNRIELPLAEHETPWEWR